MQDMDIITTNGGDIVLKLDPSQHSPQIMERQALAFLANRHHNPTEASRNEINFICGSASYPVFLSVTPPTFVCEDGIQVRYNPETNSTGVEMSWEIKTRLVTDKRSGAYRAFVLPAPNQIRHKLFNGTNMADLKVDWMKVFL